MNVKSPTKGRNKRNIAMDPIKSVSDWKLCFLREVADWLTNWQLSKQSGLSSETFLAVKHTCQAVADLSENLLLHHDFQYVLTGQFLSDPIEKRFGWYRQLSGGNYFISVNQVLENEKKIRIISLLKFSNMTASEIPARFSLECESPSAESLDKLYDYIRDLEITDVVDNADLNIILYVAGYVSRSVERSTKCIHCSSKLCSSDSLPMPFFEGLGESDAFLQILDRGGLTKPSDCIFSFLIVGFAIFQVLCKKNVRHHLLFMTNARLCFIETVLRKVRSDDYLCSIFNLQLECGHSFENLLKLVCRQFFNCLSKNLAKYLTVVATETSSRKLKKFK